MAVPRRSLTLLRRLARHNGGLIDATVRDITASWLQAWNDLDPAWQAGIAAILDQYASTGVWPPPWQVTRIEAVARATVRTERSLAGLLAVASAMTTDAAGRISAATLAAEPTVIAAQSAAVTAVELAETVPTSTVASALAARRNRIGALHRPIAADVVAAIGRVFTHPPTTTGRAGLDAGMLTRIRAGFDGGLTRTVTIARTEPVDAYRTTAQIVHAANPRLVTGWAWLCQLDLRACVSCWAMHGTRHPLDEPGPAGHPSDRCQRLPLVGANTLPSAETRFRRLSRRDQLTVLGPARLELFRSGQIGWADLAVRRAAPGWRDSYVPRPVADLQRLAGIRTP